MKYPLFLHCVTSSFDPTTAFSCSSFQLAAHAEDRRSCRLGVTVNDLFEVDLKPEHAEALTFIMHSRRHTYLASLFLQCQEKRTSGEGNVVTYSIASLKHTFRFGHTPKCMLEERGFREKRGPSNSLAASGVFLVASGVLSLLDPPLQQVLTCGGREGGRRAGRGERGEISKM